MPLIFLKIYFYFSKNKKTYKKFKIKCRPFNILKELHVLIEKIL
jgi:hypothetical protein